MAKLIAVKIQQADVKNNRGRIWPLSILCEVCEMKRIFGTVNGYLNINPDSALMGPEIYEISHTVDNLRIQDGWLVGDVEILDTAFGELLGRLLTSAKCNFVLRGVKKINQTTGRIERFIPLSIDAVKQIH